MSITYSAVLMSEGVRQKSKKFTVGQSSRLTTLLYVIGEYSKYTGKPTFQMLPDMAIWTVAEVRLSFSQTRINM